MFIKFFIAAAIFLNLNGCLFKENIESLMALKRLGEEQKSIARSLKLEERLFRKLVAHIKKDKLKPGTTLESFIGIYGEPIVSKDTLSSGKRLLYRHPTDYFNSDKVYVYFDREEKLSWWEYLPAKVCLKK